MDIIEIALAEQKGVITYKDEDPFEGIGINAPEELVVAEKYIKQPCCGPMFFDTSETSCEGVADNCNHPHSYI